MSESNARTGDRIGSWVLTDLVDLAAIGAFNARHTEVEETEATLTVEPYNAHNEERQGYAVDALKRCESPHLPVLLDFGVDHDRGLLFTVTEPILGTRLSDLMLAEPLEWRKACVLFDGVARALLALHEASLVHRDIQPAKIFVDPEFKGTLVGLETSRDVAALNQSAASELGELRYLAPEAISDPHHHGARCDLYALGVVFHEALTGRSGFPAATFGEQLDPARRMLDWKTRAAPLDPGPAHAPPWLCNLIRKATDPDPDKRLPDMDAFVGWLEAAEELWRGPSDEPRTPSAWGPTPVEAPPRLQMAVPSNKGPSAELVAQLQAVESIQRPPAPPLGLVYATSSVLGGIAGLAFSAVLIVFLELAVS